MTDLSQVKALLFDVFGTCVDWRSSVARDLAAFAGERGLTGVDWTRFADDWRALYQPAMEDVRSGRRPFTILDVLHRESLDNLLDKYAVTGLSEADRDHVNRVWHRLDPWPDTVPGLIRLKSKYILATLSNGNVALMVNMAKRAGLPWDVILGSEIARAYKRQPEVYLSAARVLGLAPDECMMVAAHNRDHEAAAALGLRTAFIHRPTEYGPDQTTDLAPSRAWDIVADTMTGVAEALGC